MASTLTTEEVYTALRKRFDPPEWVFLPQVRDHVGGGHPAARTADAVAFNTYASRGYAVHGVEVKNSRSDLRNELKDPDKAEAVGKYCDYWWLVVGDREILDGLHIPKAWGILWPRGDHLVQKRAAPEQEHTEDLDRPFLAAVLRRFNEEVKNDTQLEAEYERGRQRGKKQAKRKLENRAERAERKLEELEEKVEAFEDATGLNLRRIQTGDVGFGRKPEEMAQAVAVVLEAEDDSYGSARYKLEKIYEQACEIQDDLEPLVGEEGDG